MHPWITEALAREREADMRGWPGSTRTEARWRRRRPGQVLGWWLIHLGLRLVTTDGRRVRLSGKAATA